jgi:hypothetical protein
MYLSLVIGISILYDKIFRKGINSLIDSNDKTNSKEPLNNLKEKIEFHIRNKKFKKLSSLIEKVSIGRRLMEFPEMENN